MAKNKSSKVREQLDAYRREIDELKTAVRRPPNTQQPTGPKPFVVPDFKPDLGKIDADTDVGELIGKIVSAVNDHVKGVLTAYDKHNESVQTVSKEESKKAELARTIRDFKEKTPDFEKHLDRMNYYFEKGHPIEECYRLAKIDAGEDPKAVQKPGKNKKPAEVDEVDEEDTEDEEAAEPGSSISSDDEEDEDEEDRSMRAPKQQSMGDKIKSRVSSTLKKTPSLLEAIDQ